MKRNDTTFNSMVARLQAGEITRAQAADEYGIGAGTLNVWVSRSGLGDTIPNQRGKPMAGAAAAWGALSPDKVAATDAALARVLAGEISALAASKLDPNVSARTLAKKVRQARLAKGMPVQFRTAPAKPTHPAARDTEASLQANEATVRVLQEALA